MGSGKQQYREVVAWLRARSWTVDEDRTGYPRARCPCGRHQKTIHRTPSNPLYFQQLKNRIRMMERECREKGERE
ncbi:MAG: hypothetical protein QOD07_1804 [Frankiaceae bacterium]|jgi:hypothetical protein|nr:hypothetical protein [Frankiaceae bacterium]